MRSKDFWCSALNLACTEKFNPSIRHGKGSQWIEKKYYLPTSYTSALLKYLHKNVYFMPKSLFTQCEKVLFFSLQTRSYHVSCFSRKYFALNHNKLLMFFCKFKALAFAKIEFVFILRGKCFTDWSACLDNGNWHMKRICIDAVQVHFDTHSWSM